MDIYRKKVLISHSMVETMSFSDEIFGYAAAAVPGVGAGLLSLYNWYKMQGGAKLAVEPFVTYGLYHPSRGQKADEKYLYVPILINNTGPKTGVVTNVEITFRSEKMEEKALKIEKRVETENTTGSSTNDDFVVAVPQFPTFVPDSEGSLIMVECLDIENDVIPVDEDLICKITVFDGKNRKNSVEFPFRLSSVDLKRAKNVIWIRAFTADPHPSSDQFLLRKFVKEAGVEEKYEALLNNAYFDRSVASKGMKIGKLKLKELKKIKFLPECIGDFTELTELDLTEVVIEQSLPESIGRLKKLKKLKMGYMQLSTIPDSIGNLTELEELQLHKNELTSLPELGNLTKLKYLNISFNKLVKLPDSIGRLINLQNLNAIDNELTSVPQISSLTSLTKLWLRNNQLVSIPENIDNLSKLRSLALANNQIESIPSSIGNLEDLQELEVVDNKIRILPETLFNLKNMVTMVCSPKEIEEENFEKIKTWVAELKKTFWNASIRSNVL